MPPLPTWRPDMHGTTRRSQPSIATSPSGGTDRLEEVADGWPTRTTLADARGAARGAPANGRRRAAAERGAGHGPHDPDDPVRARAIGRTAASGARPLAPPTVSGRARGDQ